MFRAALPLHLNINDNLPPEFQEEKKLSHIYVIKCRLTLPNIINRIRNGTNTLEFIENTFLFISSNFQELHIYYMFT